MDALASLLVRPEGKTLEHKRDLSSPQSVLRTLVAFANTAGGTLLIGVEDGTRDVVGVDDVLALEERLANLVADSIAPRLLPEIETHPWRQTQVIAATVHPGGNLPFYLKKLGRAAGVYVRLGSTNRKADVDTIRGLRRQAAGESYDEEALPDLDSEAIDFRAASELFADVRRLRRRDLESLRLLTRWQDRLVPTVGGVLLCGKERLKHFPDAWVHVGRFEGSDRSRILDSRRLEGGLVSAIEEAIGFVERHLTREIVVGRVRRTERWSFPPAALREAIVNAVAHADYSVKGAPIRVSVFDDRIEVTSPGLLPIGLTVEDIRQGVSKVRNRVIARVLHELNLVEQWGSGIPRMAKACRAAGIVEPEFEELGGQFHVMMRFDASPALIADPVDQRILQLVRGTDGLSTSVIADGIGLSARATRTRLAKLVERGLLFQIGSGPRDPRRRYLAPPEATT